MQIADIVKTQRAFFERGLPQNLMYRQQALQALQRQIQRRRGDVEDALLADLGKQPMEAYMTETGLVAAELRHTLRHFRRWAAPRPVLPALAQLPSVAFTSCRPYGVALVISPWNYPFQLSVNPVIAAVAAGNCVVLKPSAYAPATSALLAEMIAASFRPEHVTVVQGGREENKSLLKQRFDTIFFTGSVEVGKTVLAQAAKTLTPVTLELGGKSPCIVDAPANISLVARRIVFGKLLNAGQTCIAPDYVLVQRDAKDALLAAMKQCITQFLGEDPLQNPEWPRIVNEKHFARLLGLLSGERLFAGGGSNAQALKIEPTLLDTPAPDSPVMSEEIFGPILPVIPYDTLDDAIGYVNAREKPLALYLFSDSRATARRVLGACSFGGGCINDTIMHIATPHMPFGGVGHSGMGGYHGRAGFDTFSHRRSLVRTPTMVDLPLRYHPYTPLKEGILRAMLR